MPDGPTGTMNKATTDGGVPYRPRNVPLFYITFAVLCCSPLKPASAASIGPIDNTFQDSQLLEQVCMSITISCFFSLGPSLVAARGRQNTTHRQPTDHVITIQPIAWAAIIEC